MVSSIQGVGNGYIEIPIYYLESPSLKQNKKYLELKYRIYPLYQSDMLPVLNSVRAKALLITNFLLIKKNWCAVKFVVLLELEGEYFQALFFFLAF